MVERETWKQIDIVQCSMCCSVSRTGHSGEDGVEVVNSTLMELMKQFTRAMTFDLHLERPVEVCEADGNKEKGIFHQRQ